VGDAGLTPLAGGIAWWLEAARAAAAPLYDFDGLRRFRAACRRRAGRRSGWSGIARPAALVLLDMLRAFAGDGW
jgi:hypothetical protein